MALTEYEIKKLFSPSFFSLGGRVNYSIISHKQDSEKC